MKGGQAKFRKALLAAYREKCAITGCDVVEALEAAHISPYRGDHSDHVQNGLLLRAGLHSLFDLGLISIDPRTMSVVIATELVRTTYGELVKSSLALPYDPKQKPSEQALAAHLEWSGIQVEVARPAGQRRLVDRIIAALELELLHAVRSAAPVYYGPSN